MITGKTFMCLICCIATVGLVLFVPAMAAAYDDSGIACVDLDKISKLAKPVQDIITSVEDTLKPKKEEVEGKLKQLDMLKLTYEQQKTILSDEQRKTRREEIAILEKEIQVLSDEINKMLNSLEKDQLEPAYNLVMNRIEKIAKRRGLKVVLMKEFVVYNDPALDITDDVIKELNTGKEVEVESTPEPSPTSRIMKEETPVPEPEEVEVKATPPPTPPPTPKPTSIVLKQDTPVPEPEETATVPTPAVRDF
jgi:outer membrane protein